jgi:hypothetical protein
MATKQTDIPMKERTALAMPEISDDVLMLFASFGRVLELLGDPERRTAAAKVLADAAEKYRAAKVAAEPVLARATEIEEREAKLEQRVAALQAREDAVAAREAKIRAAIE